MNGRQRGVALAIVVWFIAGMSLLVAGIVALAQVDVRTTQLHLARAKAVAAGDGAIQLAMVERYGGSAQQTQSPQVSESREQVGDTQVLVRIYPATGFVDANHAPAEVLSALFATVGGLSPTDAGSLAANVVKWRAEPAAGTGRSVGVRQRFHSLEDMLRVDGVTRTILDAIRDYAVAGDWMQGDMNWSLAPEQLLDALDSIDPQKGSVAQNRRQTMSQGSTLGRGNEAFKGAGVYRVDALLDYGGRTWLRRRWLSMGGSTQSRLPWSVVHTEAPRIVAVAN